MTLPTLTASQVSEKMRQGAILVDIRSQDEYLRKHIDGAICLPIDKITELSAQIKDGDVVIFHCLSGMRTRQYAEQLRACHQNCQMYLLDGGLSAWQQAGLPVQTTKTGTSLDIMRQVQLIAGGLIVLGAVGGAMLSPAFYWLCAFVGAGLFFAGLTGFCGMARLLALMPWNKLS